MHVAVAIVGFRNLADIERCIAALEAATYTDFEVVICENGGGAAFRALAEKLPKTLRSGQPITVFQAARNLGYAGGVNACMQASASADAWWVLNPDTEAEPAALEELVKRLARGDCQAVGGVIYLPSGRVQAYAGHWRPALARAVSIGHGQGRDAPVDAAAVERAQSYLNGACMLVSRAFLEQAGPMREDYFLYCEEVEWFLRAKARGLRLGFAPMAQVLHHAGTTTGSYNRTRAQPKTPVYLDERNKILVTRDCFPALLPVAGVAALILLVLRFGKRGAWRQIGYGLQGWAAGLANRRGPPAWIDTTA